MDIKWNRKKETQKNGYVDDVKDYKGYVFSCYDDDDNKSVGLYFKDGKWTMYRNKWHPEYAWDTLKEAMAACVAMIRMNALP